MVVGVTSQNNIKVDAVRSAYMLAGIPTEVVGFITDSKVGDAPVNEKTIQGARNRINDLKKKVTQLDSIVSIENGIFWEGEKWLDKAVVIIYNPVTNKEYIGYSDSVVFPNEFVEKARQIGFDKITLGQVMQQAGFVDNHIDPHLSITGISRQKYLEDTVFKLLSKIKEESCND